MSSAKITFKAKPYHLEGVYSGEPDPHDRVKVPELKRSHCDMAAFRRHPKHGGYANSDMFPAVLKRIARQVAPHGYLRLDRLPEGVTATPGALLTTITIEV